jgi:hypothetical protein
VVFAFIATLTVVTFIDLDHRIIPDTISLPGIPIFFVAALAVPSITWQASAIGIVAGGGSLFAVAWVYQLITGREGMGGGDIKLLAMIGAMIGWQGFCSPCLPRRPSAPSLAFWPWSDPEKACGWPFPSALFWPRARSSTCFSAKA